MHNTHVKLRSVVLAGLLIAGVVVRASAQRVGFGGGINGGSVPRAMAPLCNGARRLGGGGLSASVGVVANRIRLNANIDHVAHVGVYP
jgi:hypothetical protein